MSTAATGPAVRDGMPSRSHTTHVTIGVPVIPSPYIDFIIVNADDRYMLRCERRKILENSIELGKMVLAGPNSGRRGDPHYQITNIDKYDFELLVRFLETSFIKYRDHLHILRILDLADRFKCPDLVGVFVFFFVFFRFLSCCFYALFYSYNRIYGNGNIAIGCK